MAANSIEIQAAATTPQNRIVHISLASPPDISAYFFQLRVGALAARR
jgi:hypothetical protein